MLSCVLIEKAILEQRLKELEGERKRVKVDIAAERHQAKLDVCKEREKLRKEMQEERRKAKDELESEREHRRKAEVQVKTHSVCLCGSGGGMVCCADSE